MVQRQEDDVKTECRSFTVWFPVAHGIQWSTELHPEWSGFPYFLRVSAKAEVTLISSEFDLEPYHTFKRIFTEQHPPTMCKQNTLKSKYFRQGSSYPSTTDQSKNEWLEEVFLFPSTFDLSVSDCIFRIFLPCYPFKYPLRRWSSYLQTSISVFIYLLSAACIIICPLR